MRGAALQTIIGREARPCWCGITVEHVVSRAAARRHGFELALGLVYQARPHRAPCGKPCSAGDLPADADPSEPRHIRECAICKVERGPAPRACLDCGLWLGEGHVCPEPYTCRECGENTRAKCEPRRRAQLEAARLCVLCDFWLGKLELRASSRVVRAGGVHYYLGEDHPRIPAAARGHGGRRAIITFKDGRRVVSSNVWYEGTIPRDFRARLPDNAVLVWEDEVPGPRAAAG